MPKLGMGPIRRKQLVEAAIATIHEDGFASATVARIARRAGVSSGIVHHYFSNKEDLLFEAMRSLLADLRTDTVARLGRAHTPRQRLDAVIDATFGDGQFSEQVFSAWLAFYGSARKSPRLRQLLELYHRRLRANLLNDLLLLSDRGHAERVAAAIGAIIDGLWLRYALIGPPASPEIPQRLARECLDAQLARGFGAPPDEQRGSGK